MTLNSVMTTGTAVSAVAEFVVIFCVSRCRKFCLDYDAPDVMVYADERGFTSCNRPHGGWSVLVGGQRSDGMRAGLPARAIIQSSCPCMFIPCVSCDWFSPVNNVNNLQSMLLCQFLLSGCEEARTAWHRHRHPMTRLSCNCKFHWRSVIYFGDSVKPIS